MNIVYFSNFLSPHVKPFCDTLYKLLNKEFKFVQTMSLSDERRRLGYNEFLGEYVIDLTSRIEELKLEANKADCAIFTLGSIPYEIILDRIKKNKLTFFISERLFKRGWLKFLDIKLWKQIRLNILSRNKNVYLLCNGSFVKQDFELMGFHKNHSFKFGYFPFCDFTINKSQYDDEFIKIIWIGRMINWKRPELMLKIGYYISKIHPIELTFIGDGPLFKKLQCLSRKLMNENYIINFEGIVPNYNIRSKIINSDMLLITSNKREGWGAVVNEALAVGVPVIADNMIGSAEYLIDEGLNGYTFKDGDIKDAVEKIEKLKNNKNKIDFYNNSIKKMQLWNGCVAATRLFIIVKILNNMESENCIFKNGPLSEA